MAQPAGNSMRREEGPGKTDASLDPAGQAPSSSQTQPKTTSPPILEGLHVQARPTSITPSPDSFGQAYEWSWFRMDQLLSSCLSQWLETDR